MFNTTTAVEHSPNNVHTLDTLLCPDRIMCTVGARNALEGVRFVFDGIVTCIAAHTPSESIKSKYADVKIQSNLLCACLINYDLAALVIVAHNHPAL